MHIIAITLTLNISEGDLGSFWGRRRLHSVAICIGQGSSGVLSPPATLVIVVVNSMDVVDEAVPSVPSQAAKNLAAAETSNANKRQRLGEEMVHDRVRQFGRQSSGIVPEDFQFEQLADRIGRRPLPRTQPSYHLFSILHSYDLRSRLEPSQVRL